MDNASSKGPKIKDVKITPNPCVAGEEIKIEVEIDDGDDSAE